MSKYKQLTPKSALGFKILNFGRTATGKTASIATLLLAGQKVRFLSADNNALAGIEAGLNLHKINKEDVDLSICVPQRPSLAAADILASIDNILKSDIETLMKGKDKNRKNNTGFRNIYAGALNFIDTLTGEDKGNVLEWGIDTTLVVDSLTTVCDEIQLTVAGNKASTWPEYHQEQILLKNFVNHITTMLKCNVVLLAHPTKDVDTVTGSTSIYPLNIGTAMNESFSSNFSDVLYSQYNGKKYIWSTSHRTAVCSGRNFPIKEELEQDFRQAFI